MRGLKKSYLYSFKKRINYISNFYFNRGVHCKGNNFISNMKEKQGGRGRVTDSIVVLVTKNTVSKHVTVARSLT